MIVELVAGGFSLADVQAMTIDQFRLYVNAAGKHALKRQLAEMGTSRIAYHAESKEYSKIVRENERLLKRD